MEFIRHGYCGLYCGACPVFLATESDELEKLAAEMKMNPKELACYGCKSEQVAVFCRECVLKTCSREKGYEFCGHCQQHPCQDIQNFYLDSEYPYHEPVPKNHDEIAACGLEEWLKKQDSRWRCTKCNNKFAWKDDKCPCCGENVASYREDLG